MHHSPAMPSASLTDTALGQHLSSAKTFGNVGKSSLKISLILMGTASLSACQNQNTLRYEYNNRQDCVKDWGETECPPEQGGSGGGRVGSGYYYYRSAYADKTVKPTHAKSVVRGGFGSSTRGGS